MGSVVYKFISSTKSRVVYHKKSFDQVIGAFLLRVVALFSELLSEVSILFQPRLIGEVVLCRNNE